MPARALVCRVLSYLAAIFLCGRPGFGFCTPPARLVLRAARASRTLDGPTHAVTPGGRAMTITPRPSSSSARLLMLFAAVTLMAGSTEAGQPDLLDLSFIP